MQFLIFIFYFTVTLFLFLNASNAKGTNAKSILVDQSGKGHFKTVQEAIDSIPSNNNKWTIIDLNPGTYKEKVKIPKEKPYFILRGKSRDTTVIEYGDYGNSLESSTFKLFAENFMASGITFTNTYDIGKDEVKKITWAPAALIQADKASFFGCGFVGIQDTLADLIGHHYFKNCYIEGSVDFI
nr:putative pectinesterase 29 [Quercus suber]